MSPSQTEAEIKRDIIQYLRTHNFFVWNNPNITPGRRKHQVKVGVSDILAIHNDGSGRMICIEVKKEGGRLSVEQEEFLHTVRAFNGIAFVARSIEDAKEKLFL
jgi:hypothetical protein